PPNAFPVLAPPLPPNAWLVTCTTALCVAFSVSLNVSDEVAAPPAPPLPIPTSPRPPAPPCAVCCRTSVPPLVVPLIASTMLAAPPLRAFAAGFFPPAPPVGVATPGLVPDPAETALPWVMLAAPPSPPPPSPVALAPLPPVAVAVAVAGPAVLV